MSEINENNKCVYVHKDKEGIIRYVGSGTLKRANRTEASSDRNKQYAEFVAQNGRLEVEIIAEGLTKFNAEELERKLYDENFDTVLNARRPSSPKTMTKEMFNEFFYYDDTSKSCLRWKINIIGGKGAVSVKAGTEAGSLGGTGYYQVSFKKCMYKVHRIIVVLHDIDINGYIIDHIDRNRRNNKIENLRVVTQKENCKNRSRYDLSKRNVSGELGVHLHEGVYWVASWCINTKVKCKYSPIAKYSSSDEAFNAAIEYRKEMVDLYYNN